MRFLPLLLATAFAASACSHWRHIPPDERRAVVLSLDGGGEQVLERMLAAGVMPHLARLASRGVQADYSRTNTPSKTAAGHAALWTGAFANVNGITTNEVMAIPASRHTVLELQDGFLSTTLLAEPIWVSAARAGKRVQVLQSSHLTPLSAYQPGGVFGGPYRGSMVLIDGFGFEHAHEGVMTDAKAWKAATGWAALPASAAPPREAALPIGESTLWGLAYDDPADPATGYDTLAVHAERSAAPLATLKPGPAGGFTRALPVATPDGPGRSYLRLFALAPDLSGWLLYHTAPTRPQTNRPEAASAVYQDRTFIPGGGIRSWYASKLGKTMFEGGDGLAERRYRETVAHMLDQTGTTMVTAMQRRDWDLLINYLPFPDESLHSMYGAVDTHSPSYQPELAPRVWSELERVFAELDRFIGRVADSAPADTVIAIASDHGMAGLKWTFNPNTVLREAGLLAVDAQGQVDLSRTRVIYPPANGGFLVVNRVGRKGGIVPVHQVDTVIERARVALSAVKTHDGKPLMTGFVRPGPDTADLGLGGPRGGDAYLDLQPGYYFGATWNSPDRFKALKPGSAGHVFDARRSDMHAFMLLAGPGIKRGEAIGPVRNTDLAPTLSHLLGIPAPAQTTGRVIEEALAL